jgi:hypothetical protein
MISRVFGDLYPRGFIAPSPRSDIIRVTGSGDITALYDQMMQRQVNHNGWAYQKRVLQVAMNCFNNFPQFITTQKNNPFLYGYNYEFLIDTLRFIQTGRRRVSVQNWLALLLENHSPNNDYRDRGSSKDIHDFLKAVGSSDTSVVSAWVSRPGGLNDLVVSLYIMFGEVRDKRSKADATIDVRALAGKFV